MSPVSNVKTLEKFTFHIIIILMLVELKPNGK